MMKKFLQLSALSTTIIILIYLSGFTFQGTSLTNYYFYKDKPYYLDLVPDAVFLELKENADEASLNNLLNEFPSLFLKRDFSFTYRKDFIYLNQSLAEESLIELLNNLNEKEIVKNASPVFKMMEGQGGSDVLLGVEGEIIAQFKPSVSDNEIEDYLNENGLNIVQEFNLSGGKTYLLEIPEGKYAIDYANELYQTGFVNYSEPNLYFENLLQADVIPNDPLYPQQWAHHNTGNNIPGGVLGTPGCDMRTDSAWLFTMGNPDVIVSIVDTGIDTLHEDLNERIVNGLSIDTYNNLPYAWDDNNHGTSCAGIVAATGNNNLGVIGVAPESRLFGVKIFNSFGNTNSVAIINGLIAAWERGSWVSSNSWGGGSPISAAENAIEDGVNFGRNGKGVVWVFATGNDNTSYISWPSTHPDVISVGALSPCAQRKSTTSCDGENWWGSQYGDGLEIVSPGVKIYTTDRTGASGYTTGNYVPNFNGTSSATPNVSGVVSLMLSVNPDLNWDEVREIICLTADKVGSYTYNQPGQLSLGGWNNQMGYGKVNAYKAVKLTVELMGPRILHSPLGNTEDVNGPYIIEADISSFYPINPNEIKVVWGVGNGVFTDTLSMSNTGGNSYTASINGIGSSAVYSYYIYAEDSTGLSSTLPEGAPANYFSFEAATDFNPPVINHTPLTDITFMQWPVTISAEVTDNIGISEVECEIKINGGTSTIFPLELVSGNTYTGTPNSLSVSVGDFVEYKIKAEDISSQSNISFHPETGYHSFNINDTRGLVLILDDDVSSSDRISSDKGFTEAIDLPLGASANIINSKLSSIGYYVEQYEFNSVDTSIIKNFDLVIITAGVKASSLLSNAAVRKAISDFTLSGGKTLVEGGEVGYTFRKTSTADPDPLFRREVLNDSSWVSDRSGGNLNTQSGFPLFNNPNTIPATINVSDNGYGARDEVTLLPKTGVSRIAYWSNGINSNGGIIIHHPDGDTSVARNVFYTFSITQLSQSTAEELIENTVDYLMRDLVVPVELTSFTASTIGAKINLSWQTASEINNKGFEIERSQVDGKWKMENGKFIRQSVNEDGWEMIGFINGKGTTTEQQVYSFTDENLLAGKYQYRLKQIDFDGSFSYSNIIEVEVLAPSHFSLEQNYPNPFNPATQINFSLASDSKVILKVYNVMGQEVKTLLNENRKAGFHHVNFDASDLSSGVYFYSIETSGDNGNNFSAVKKMILLK